MFDARRRRVFLEWFAATCNARLSCEKAGITQRTAYRHRREDSAFAEAWEEALQQGYAAVEASLVADALRGFVQSDDWDGDEKDEAEGPLHHPADGSPPHPRLRGDREELTFEQRMAVLREYRRSDGGGGPRAQGKATPVAGRVATAEEVEAALIKRLKNFAVRVATADAEGRSAVPPARTAKSGVPVTKRNG